MANINLTNSSNIEVVQNGTDISLDFASGGQVETNTTAIGTLANLNTTDKSSLVNAINETIPVVLYDNGSGSTTDITLNDSVSNYSYLEIIFGWNTATFGLTSSLVDLSNEYSANLSTMVFNNSYIYFATSFWSMSGTTISVNGGEYWRLGTNGTQRTQTQNIAIYKVLGYK